MGLATLNRAAVMPSGHHWIAESKQGQWGWDLNFWPLCCTVRPLTPPSSLPWTHGTRS